MGSSATSANWNIEINDSFYLYYFKTYLDEKRERQNTTHEKKKHEVRTKKGKPKIYKIYKYINWSAIKYGAMH